MKYKYKKELQRFNICINCQFHFSILVKFGEEFHNLTI